MSYSHRRDVLQVIALCADTRKECGSHLMTSAVDADPMRKGRLLSIFSVSARLLVDVDIGYLSPNVLSA